MRGVIAAAASYFGIVFLCGFGLGAVRFLVVAPRIGATAAVLLEAPLILTASWFACRWCVTEFDVPATNRDRLAMGTVALALLMAAEAALAVLMFDRSLGDWLAAFGALPGALGLLAQVAFGLVPIVQGSRPAP